MSEAVATMVAQGSFSSFHRRVVCELLGAKNTLWERNHLWLYLLALGFDPTLYHGSLVLGANMFDKPNRRAFHVVVIFLFMKLDQSRAVETFSGMSCPIGSTTDCDFRKACCKWLKDISKEKEVYLPKITPSSLLSPGGPKFVHLLYHLTRHVVIENMETISTGTGASFAEAIKVKPTDVYIANARRRVACKKLIKILKKEDLIIQEYKKKAQLLIKKIKQMKSEYAFLQVEFWKMKKNNQKKDNQIERIQKVRSMWTVVTEILTSLKKEKEDVDSVLEDGHDQCILDGTNVFRIPQLLIDRVESDVHQLCTGNLYEDQKLNFLRVIQLLNEALRTLRDENCISELKQLPVFENRITICKKVLEDLTAKRLEIEQQHCMSTSGSICRKQKNWELKWKSFLGLCPFNLLLDQDPVLDCLRALQPYSFNPAEDGDDSDFCQHLVSVSDLLDSIHEVHCEKDGASAIVMDKATSPKWISPVSLELSKPSENREVLIEKSLPNETCKYKKKPVHPKILKNGKDESATSEMQKNNVIQTELPVKREDPLKKARDELAEEVANTVMSESPQNSEEKRMALEDLISLLAFDPFLTRKQIPRTPENLLNEIRSSWRKAIQTEDSSGIELAPSVTMTEESPMDARLRMQKTSDSRLMCSVPASPVPGFESSLLEKKSQLSSTKLKSRKQLSHIIEPSVLETSGMQENETIEAQELKCTVSNKSSTEDPEEKNFQYVKILTTPDTCSENNRRTCVLPSDYFQSSLMDGMLHWNVSSLSYITPEDGYLGILGETLPEELHSTDFSISTSPEIDSYLTESACVRDDSKNEDIKSKLNLWSPFNTYEVLKQTESRSEDELYQTHNGAEFVSSRSNPSLGTEERDEWNSPLKLFCLDEEFTKMPLPESPNERKLSLSSVLVSCQHLEEMASMPQEIPFNLIQKLKEKELLNEKLGMKKPSG